MDHNDTNPNPNLFPVIPQPVVDNLSVVESRNEAPDKTNWIKRHKTALGLAGFAVAGAISLTQSENVIDELESTGKWVAPTVAVTESIAWLGGGMMILAAGNKVGNPLTIKTRLKEVAHELVDNKYYQRGWYVGATGAIGTASVVAGAAISSLPKESWPLALTISGASLGFSSLSLPRKSKSSEVGDQ